MMTLCTCPQQRCWCKASQCPLLETGPAGWDVSGASSSAPPSTASASCWPTSPSSTTSPSPWPPFPSMAWGLLSCMPQPSGLRRSGFLPPGKNDKDRVTWVTSTRDRDYNILPFQTRPGWQHCGSWIWVWVSDLGPVPNCLCEPWQHPGCDGPPL